MVLFVHSAVTLQLQININYIIAMGILLSGYTRSFSYEHLEVKYLPLQVAFGSTSKNNIPFVFCNDPSPPQYPCRLHWDLHVHVPA